MPNTPDNTPRRGLTGQRRDQLGTEGERREPRLPHERDESSDSQNTGDVRGVMQQAHDDLREGQQDTDRGPPLDRAYQHQKAGGDRSGTDAPKTPRRR